MNMTVHTGECMSKNVCLLQDTTFLLSTQILHPFLCLQPRRVPPKGTERWKSHPHLQPVLKAPSSLSLLRGGVAAAWLPTGVDRRAWVAAGCVGPGPPGIWVT